MGDAAILPGMAAPLITDPAVLVKEAANFQRIADEIKAVITRVEQAATDLDNHWQGLAADAAKQALARYHEAATAQVQLLNEISTNLHTAAAKYTATDDEHSAQLASAMSYGMGGPLPTDYHPWEYNLDLTSPVYMDAQPSVDDVWNELHRCFNCNFPIGGAPQGFPKVGDELPLEIKAAGQKFANLPVKVTQVQKTADAINIEFATAPGHVDGPGSTIHFTFGQENDGKLHLKFRGYITEGPGAYGGAAESVDPLARAFYGGLVAPVTWQPYIDRLMDNIKTHPSGPPVTHA